MDARSLEERKEAESTLSEPRFLIIRFSAIGDCVMAAWAATAIRNRYPNAYICWAVEERCRPVIDTKRLVDTVVEIPREKWRRQKFSWSVFREQASICNRLRLLKFDFGLDLQGHLKTAICLKFAFPRKRVAVGGTDGISRVLNPIPAPMPADVHWIDWHMKTLGTLGDFETPQKPIMPDAPQVTPKLATISTSAGHPSKVYPADYWKEVAEALDQDGFDVAFLGAPGDPKIDFSKGVDYVGKLSLLDSMRMVASSAIHLAGDTGTGHMAAAYDVPIVSIFGHMEPSRYHPYTSKGRVLRNGTDARNVPPCDVIANARELIARCGA